MPRVIRVAVPTPVNVEAAVEVFGSSVRVHLIRHYREHPGSQVDAAAALGVPLESISRHARKLASVGVLIQERDGNDGRAWIYRVDRERLIELLAAASEFTAGSESPL